MIKKLSRKEAQEMTRTRLIDVATQSFAHQGVAGVSVDAIAREVGMTKGAVYANFATKEELFLAVLDRLMSQQDEMLEKIFAESGQTRLDALRAYLMGMFAQSREWRLLVTEFWLHAAREPAIQQKLALRYQMRRQKIAQFVRRQFSEEQTALPLSAEQIASILIALSNGLEMQHIIEPTAISDDLFASFLALLIQKL